MVTLDVLTATKIRSMQFSRSLFIGLTLTILLQLSVSITFGQDYFQQEVNTTIDVTLNDEAHELRGNVAIEYVNNSPDQLSYIWMHLWPNAYSGPNTALAKQQFRNGNMFMFYAMNKSLGGIDSLDFRVNGIKAEWEFHPEHPDIAKVKLKGPLNPGQRITITTPFKVKIPSGRISRLGHVGQSYQITQWFPKPAVYDRDGWHEMPYLNQGEFYSEFGSYDVSITLPKNYVLGATGDRMDNPTEVAFMDSLAEATAKLDEFPKRMEFPPSSSEMKTVRFTQSNVHDFAWFADKRWYALKGEVALPNSGRKVTTWGLFTSANAEYWKRSIEYLNDATYYYSLWNGEYPYNHVTAVDGTISAGGGMEYPNITVIGNTGSDLGLETVIMHEVGHNWFYGILGSNERTNAWMDEGINSFNETRYFYTKYDTLELLQGMLPDKARETLELNGVPYRMQDELSYLISARFHVDQPMQCHSDDFRQINYGTIVYKKTAAAFEYLKEYLGEERFDIAMQAYFEEWKFKHPQPEDLRRVMEESTGEVLDWFFEQLVKTDGRVDYKLKHLKEDSDSLRVTVRNKGFVRGPFQLSGFKNGELVTEQWYGRGTKEGEDRTVGFPKGDYDEIRLDGNKVMLEYDRANNQMRTSGLFKKVEPLSLKFLTRLENPDETQLFYFPVVGWNNQNRFMAGVHLHNTTLPTRDWEFALTPMYSFSNGTLNGFARASYFKGPMEVNLYTRKFRRLPAFESFFDGWTEPVDYYRSGVEAIHTFNNRPNSPWSSELTIELGHLIDEMSYLDIDVDFSINGSITRTSRVRDEQMQVLLPSVAYSATREGVVVDHAFVARLRGAFSNTGQDAQYAEVIYEGGWTYNQKGKELTWRVFGGLTDSDKYFSRSQTLFPNFFQLTGLGTLGATDVASDYLFFDRRLPEPFIGLDTYEHSIEGRQIVNNQGGLRIPVFTDSWMATAVVEYDLPIGLPISVFAGGIIYEEFTGIEDWGPSDFAGGIIYEEFTGIEVWGPSEEGRILGDYSAGVTINLAKDVLEIHVPLLNSLMYQGTTSDFNPLELIMFEFNIDRLNPHKLLRSIDL